MLRIDFVSVLSAGLYLAFCGQAVSAPGPIDRKPVPKAAVYKSPEEVFEAYMKAAASRDARTEIGCLTPHAQKDMAVTFAWEAVEWRAFRERQRSGEEHKLIRKVMDRHGLTEKVTKGFKPFGSEKEVEKGKAAIAKLIKDHAAFAADIQLARDEINEVKLGPYVQVPLKDVKIDGNKARGKARFLLPFRFVKVDGGWRVITDADLAVEEAEEAKELSKDDLPKHQR